jgi:hypothetical protein
MAFPVVTAEGADIGASESLPGGCGLERTGAGSLDPASFRQLWS